MSKKIIQKIRSDTKITHCKKEFTKNIIHCQHENFGAQGIKISEQFESGRP